MICAEFADWLRFSGVVFDILIEFTYKTIRSVAGRVFARRSAKWDWLAAVGANWDCGARVGAAQRGCAPRLTLSYSYSRSVCVRRAAANPAGRSCRRVLTRPPPRHQTAPDSTLHFVTTLLRPGLPFNVQSWSLGRLNIRARFVSFHKTQPFNIKFY